MLSRRVDTEVGSGKNEGYPRLRENCSKKGVIEPVLFGEVRAGGSGWNEGLVEKGYHGGRMTMCVITQTRTLWSVKGSILNSDAGEQVSSMGDDARGMQSSEEVLRSFSVELLLNLFESVSSSVKWLQYSQSHRACIRLT